jgi:hypothetical protein
VLSFSLRERIDMTEEQPRTDYPSNSKKSKERKGLPAPENPPKNVEQIVTGTVVERKKGLFSRIASAFLTDDKQGIGESIAMDILVPAAKNMMFDSISEIGDAIRAAFERAIFGDRLPRSRYDRPGGVTTGPYISYNRVRTRAAPEYGTMTQRARARHDFSDLVFPTRGNAEDVKDELQRLIAEYGIATVEDFYKMAGVTPDFTDTAWGWEDLRGAAVRVTRGGYMIALPRPRPVE